MFEEKERIISRDNDGLYTVRSRSWIWLNEFERKFKRSINLGPGFLALGIIFLIWGFATLDALENIQIVSGDLIQCYLENANCIVLQIENDRYSIETDEYPHFEELRELVFEDALVGDSVEMAVLKTVDGSTHVVKLMHEGMEYLNNVAIQERYELEANYMLIIGSMFVILGLAMQIRKMIGKRSG